MQVGNPLQVFTALLLIDFTVKFSAELEIC